MTASPEQLDRQISESLFELSWVAPDKAAHLRMLLNYKARSDPRYREIGELRAGGTIQRLYGSDTIDRKPD